MMLRYKVKKHRKIKSLNTLNFIILMVLIFVFVCTLLYTLVYTSLNITPSTKFRNKYEESYVELPSYLDNEEIFTNPEYLEKGIEEFEKVTGVPVFVYITKNAESSLVNKEYLENTSYDLYKSIMLDDSHLFIYLLVNEPEDIYSSWFVVGKDVRNVIDTEVIEILNSYLNNYFYYRTTSLDVFLGEMFSICSNRIMYYTIPKFVFLAILIIELLIIYLYSKKLSNTSM